MWVFPYCVALSCCIIRYNIGYLNIVLYMHPQMSFFGCSSLEALFLTSIDMLKFKN